MSMRILLVFAVAASFLWPQRSAGQPPPTRPPDTTERLAAVFRAMPCVEALERDLRVIDKGQLTGDERKRYDDARSLAERARSLAEWARRVQNGEKEMEAALLALAGSKVVAPLVKRQLQLDALMAAVVQYRSGNVADARKARAGWVGPELAALARYIEENRDRLGVESTPLADIDDKALTAAAILETDVVFRGGVDATARLDFARRMLALANPARLPQRFVERWYIAVAGHLQSEFLLMETMVHVEDAVRRFPNDADILAVAGMFYEVVASPSVDLPARVGQSGLGRDIDVAQVVTAAQPNDGRYERLVTAKQTGLSRAEEFYRRAIAADADHTEAHLRLGRVLYLTARSDAALPELRVAARSRDPRLHYLASMFEGAVQEGATRFDAAVLCYEEALRACPNCLSVGLALSHAQWQTGAPELAARTLDTATERDAKSAFDDFWWDYPLGALWQRDALLRSLRGSLQ